MPWRDLRLSGQIDGTGNADLGAFDLDMRFNQAIMLAEMQADLAGILAKAVMNHKTDMAGFQQFRVRAVKIMRCEHVDRAPNC